MSIRCTMCLALAILCLLGCGQKDTTVSGKVTYNGKPIKAGTISFRPADGHGQVFAASIVNGAYAIAEAQPGKRMVAIRGTKRVRTALSEEESARLAAEAQAAGNKSGVHLGEAADYIPEDAEGNNKIVEIANGDQTFDFDVKGPPRT